MFGIQFISFGGILISIIGFGGGGGVGERGGVGFLGGGLGG